MMSKPTKPQLKRELQKEGDECKSLLLPKLINEDVVLYKIINRFPAEELHPLRIVCKQWFDTIDNNLARSQPGLLIQLGLMQPRQIYFIEVERASSKMVTVKPICTKAPLQLIGSCKGLILVWHCLTHQYFVINLVTRTSVEIPMPPPQYRYHLGISLGFDSRAGEYKVSWHFNNEKLEKRQGLIVFSVGSSTMDSWRRIDFPWDHNKWTMDHLTWADGAWHLLVYYFEVRRCSQNDYPSGGQETFFISLDASSEKFIQTHAPCSRTRGMPNLMELEGRLTMTVASNPDQLDIWVLQDLYGAGWRKKHSIKFDSLKGLLHKKFDYFFLPALLNNDIMIFQCKCGCLEWQAYDIRRGEGCAIEGIKKLTGGYFKAAHTNSLVRWNPIS